MKKLLLFFLLLISINMRSQNLVPNPSFEEHSSCPYGPNSLVPDQVAFAIGWFTTRNTPDYFNACDTSWSQTNSVPSNFAGFQNAATGSAYCGFYAYEYGNDYREMLGAQLNVPLTVGTKYYVSLKVSLVDEFYYNCDATDKIGVLFSTVHFNPFNPLPLNNFAHIFSSVIINDSVNWTLIKGSFIADSAYQFINIGNHFDNLNTNIFVNYPQCLIGYYYVDDVCVSTDSLTCYANLAGINEHKENFSFDIFPNPSSGNFTVQAPFQLLEATGITIFNFLGEIIYEQKITAEKTVIDLSTYSKGIYFVQVNDGRRIFADKVITY
jgi:hypothetical protein